MNLHASSSVERTWLSDYRPPAFAIPVIELEFDLHPSQTIVRSKLQVERIESGSDEPLFLNGHNLELESIQLNGDALPRSHYRENLEGITVFHPSNSFELCIQNKIVPASNTSLSGMYMSGNVLCTQCEAQGFRSIAYFLDRPDVLSRFTVTIRASEEEFPVLLSNGERIDSQRLPDNRHLAKWHDPYPKPSYLFALVAGKLSTLSDKFVTRSGKQITLEFYSPDDRLEKCRHALECLKQAMKWDEEVYGREYDLNRYMIVAVDKFNMGAMENKGLNIFNSKYVYAEPDTATDRDFNAVRSVIAHEYFHNWSGNRVTLRDWFQLSLKEGFTIFRDQQFSADMGSKDVQRIRDVNMVKVHQFREDAGPSRHPVQPDSYLTIDNFYTLTVYNKGAELIRMLYILLGPEAFRAATDLYFDRHDGEAVTVEDFIKALEDASGRCLKQFRLWYSTEGTPRVTVQRHHNPVEKTFELTFEQSFPNLKNGSPVHPMHIPVQIALFAPNGQPLSLKLDSAPATVDNEMLIELKELKQSFIFVNIPEQPIPSLLRGFSAPVLLEDPQANDDLYFTMSNDSDAYCRWDACQRACHLQVQKLVKRIHANQSPSIEPQFADAFGAVLHAPIENLEFKSLALEIPSEIAIAQIFDTVDPSAIHEARQFLLKTLASRHYDELMELYHAMTPPSSDARDASAEGSRSLRNLCLRLLIELDDANVQQLAHDQMKAARNMTDRAAALAALVHSTSPLRDEALQDFHNRWRDNPGIIDIWFRIQATAPRPDTLDNVIRLANHESFSIRTPNRVFSLIGAFCHSNPYCFHSPDFSGYDLLANYIIKLDKINKQAAAQLSQAFSEVRKFDRTRQQAMRHRMQSIISISNPSVNVYEIVQGILDSLTVESSLDLEPHQASTSQTNTS